MAQAPTATTPTATLSDDDVRAIDDLRAAYDRLKAELARVIVGQTAVIERLAICLFARGHGLLMGVPGLAKTLLVAKLAETMSLHFSRIQFTPDLMPMDITGTDILQDNAETGRRESSTSSTARSSPTSCSRTRSTGPHRRRRPRSWRRCRSRTSRCWARGSSSNRPFLVLATQNPVEQEGTYPLARGAAGSVHVPDRAGLSRRRPRRCRSRAPPPARPLPSLNHLLTPEPT